MGLEVFWRESAPVEGHTFAGDCYGEKSTKALTVNSLLKILKWIPYWHGFFGEESMARVPTFGCRQKDETGGTVRRRMGLQIGGPAVGFSQRLRYPRIQ